MKLLICTQTIDKNDPVLGFFHRWVEEFAKHCEQITVICLKQGAYDLPENVKVLSLGKEEGGARLRRTFRYIERFYKFIWRERKNYDGVFVHMNQEYVLLGGSLWRLWGKQVALWYNHTFGSTATHAAARIANTVFHTSPYAYTARFSNSRRMPAGIDTEVFCPLPHNARRPRSILYVGRIAPVKHVDVLVEAARILAAEEKELFSVSIYGGALPEDTEYLEELKEKAAPLIEKGILEFYGSVPNTKTPDIYATHTLSINLTPRGNYDKTVLETMACGSVALASSVAFSDVVPDMFRPQEGNPQDLAEKIRIVFELDEQEYRNHTEVFRDYVVKTHSLDTLAKELTLFFKK